MLNNYPLEKHTHKYFMIICTKNCVLPMQSWQNILHFSSGHSVGHVKKVWPFQEKIVTFFPWNLAFSVTGKKIKRLYLHIHWKIITIGPYSCLLYKLKKTGHSEGHPPVIKINIRGSISMNSQSGVIVRGGFRHLKPCTCT